MWVCKNLKPCNNRIVQVSSQFKSLTLFYFPWLNFHRIRLYMYFVHAFIEHWNAINEFMSFIMWNRETNYQWHANSPFNEKMWIGLLIPSLEISIFIRKNLFSKKIEHIQFNMKMKKIIVSLEYATIFKYLFVHCIVESLFINSYFPAINFKWDENPMCFACLANDNRKKLFINAVSIVQFHCIIHIPKMKQWGQMQWTCVALRMDFFRQTKTTRIPMRWNEKVQNIKLTFVLWMNYIQFHDY